MGRRGGVKVSMKLTLRGGRMRCLPLPAIILPECLAQEDVERVVQTAEAGRCEEVPESQFGGATEGTWGQRRNNGY